MPPSHFPFRRGPPSHRVHGRGVKRCDSGLCGESFEWIGGAPSPGLGGAPKELEGKSGRPKERGHRRAAEMPRSAARDISTALSLTQPTSCVCMLPLLRYQPCWWVVNASTDCNMYTEAILGVYAEGKRSSRREKGLPPGSAFFFFCIVAPSARFESRRGRPKFHSPLCDLVGDTFGLHQSRID